ncbi:hypothetical protein ACLOJK_015584 [Asimina triloba]
MVEIPSQPPMEAPSPSPHPPSAPCWTAIVQKPPLPKQQESSIPNRILFDGCKSSKGVAVAVVDANAIIQGGEKLASVADKVVSVREVLEEVRDPVSRRRIDFLPFSVETMEPSPESSKKGGIFFAPPLLALISFAKETGDLRTLSDVDLKLIALTYTLEAQFHGTNHLRNSPPPLHMVSVKRLPEKDMPGWGNNVPNLAEWEALENAVDTGSNFDSRILPLKDLSMNVSVDSHSGSKNITPHSVNDAQRENQEEGDHEADKAGRFAHPKKEIDLVGKKMVASGIDASQGEAAEDTSDWTPAISRSTHKRHLRKARHESAEKLEHVEESIEKITVGSAKDGSESAHIALHENSERMNAAKGILEDEAEAVDDEDDNIANILMQMRLEQDSSEFLGYDNEAAAVEPSDCVVGKDRVDEEDSVAEANGAETSGEGLDHVDISSEIEGSIGPSVVDDNSSEQSWMLQSLSDSSVACVTSDFAMQNVILQIGLRLLAPGGMQIHQLHRHVFFQNWWILKCHACNKVTTEIGRIFCPKCGNGGTLRKVSVTVGENGIILAARRPRIVRRGTRSSIDHGKIPDCKIKLESCISAYWFADLTERWFTTIVERDIWMILCGREAITKNLILREDQLPHNVLYPKLKKKPNKQRFAKMQ